MVELCTVWNGELFGIVYSVEWSTVLSGELFVEWCIMYNDGMVYCVKWCTVDKGKNALLFARFFYMLFFWPLWTWPWATRIWTIWVSPESILVVQSISEN